MLSREAREDKEDEQEGDHSRKCILFLARDQLLSSRPRWAMSTYNFIDLHISASFRKWNHTRKNCVEVLKITMDARTYGNFSRQNYHHSYFAGYTYKRMIYSGRCHM